MQAPAARSILETLDNMEETKQKFIADLLSQPVDLLASIWIIDRIPIIFDEDIKAYANWRRILASGLGVDASALLITGSAAFGISLNPYKNYKFFDDSSDIDVAVVSDYHFMEGWRTLRNIGANLHTLPQNVKQSIDDHVKRYIYWGTIATDKLLHLLPYGKQWTETIGKVSQITPTVGRTINVRVYKDLNSLRAYHVNNLKFLKTTEITRGLN
jgi:hypothetical protein